MHTDRMQLLQTHTPIVSYLLSNSRIGQVVHTHAHTHIRAHTCIALTYA